MSTSGNAVDELDEDRLLGIPLELRNSEAITEPASSRNLSTKGTAPSTERRIKANKYHISCLLIKVRRSQMAPSFLYFF